MSRTRKRNGEGSVFQVSENKWVAKISLGRKPDGTPQIKQFSGKTESAVKAKLKEFKKSLNFTEKRMPSILTVKDFFTQWLTEVLIFKLKPTSYDRIERTINNNILPYIGRMKIDKVTRSVVQNLINQLYRKDGLSYMSVAMMYISRGTIPIHPLPDLTSSARASIRRSTV